MPATSCRLSAAARRGETARRCAARPAAACCGPARSSLATSARAVSATPARLTKRQLGLQRSDARAQLSIPPGKQRASLASWLNAQRRKASGYRKMPFRRREN
eukprot:5727179-Prymnesium_polylepis.1